jgi:leucyl-tRNA synthetase
MRKLHQTIRKVSEDIPRLSYNTAVAAMMEYMNVVRRGERAPHRDEVLPLIPLVAPFAPHIAEELWEQTGGTGSVFDSAWPSFDPSLATEDNIELVVQVNGKVRTRIIVARDIAEEAALAAALADSTVARFVTGVPKKIIFVPGRLLNIVA